MMVDVGDPEATSHFVKDVEDGDGSWRWTAQNPTLKVLAFTQEGLSLSADFTIWETAFAQTGPVQLSFFVNDHLLDKIRYTEAGYKHFEKPVPASWLAVNPENIVAITVDKLYTAPQDGKKFGIILSRIGFEQK